MFAVAIGKKTIMATLDDRVAPAKLEVCKFYVLEEVSLMLGGNFATRYCPCS